MTKIKTLSICGTRPELIRLSELIKKLDLYTDHIFVHTNQSYDYEMNQIFFDELKIRKPNYMLDVKSDTVGEQIGKILIQTEKVMLKENPDAVVILGDTNSALSCIVAKRMKIPIFHLEAGNRSFDERVPEEINRRIIDYTSDVNLCYTEHARRNLLREGIHPQYIFVTGSPLNEVYEVNKDRIAQSNILNDLKLEKDKYMLVSIHREENVMNTDNLMAIMSSLNILADKYSMLIIFSTHPRTRKRIEDLGVYTNDRILFHKPFGLSSYLKLMRSTFCVLSDSGTIHEEAAIFSLPCVNIRESQERPETYDMGNVVISGIDAEMIVNSVELVRSQINIKFENPYKELNFSDKVVRLIIGLHKIVAKKEYYL